MKHKLFYTLGLMVLALVGFAANPAGAATATGPYYATPSWDQTLPVATRFIVLSNMNSEAVLDRETGLVWEQSPSTTPLNWQNAQLNCNTLEVGNRIGWRLPTLQELASLVDRTQSSPALPAGHPFNNVQSGITNAYWSATTFASRADDAWAVSFASNGGVFFTFKISNFSFWCVRGGQGVDPQ
jgi:hypothetical protein